MMAKRIKKWIIVGMADYCDPTYKKKLIREVLPPSPAVYVIYFSSERNYIGATRNLRDRIKNHDILKATRFEFDYPIQMKYQVCTKYGYELMLEARLLKRIRPKLNKKFIHKLWA